MTVRDPNAKTITNEGLADEIRAQRTSDDQSAAKWSKAQRLAVAGALAPHLRDQDGRASRRVARVDPDGNVVGYTTLAEVQKALLRQREIELEVQDGVRPKEIICETCGRVDKVGKKGAVPKCCARCRAMHCADCSTALPPSAGTPWAHRRRRGKPARCKECAARAVAAAPAASCADCAAPLGEYAMRPSAVAQRKGEPKKDVVRQEVEAEGLEIARQAVSTVSS